MTTEIANFVITPLTTAVGFAIRGTDLATLSNPNFEKTFEPHFSTGVCSSFRIRN